MSQHGGDHVIIRLGLLHPEIYEMQVRAIFEAACALAKTAAPPEPEIMHPLVAKKEEMKFLRELTDRVAEEVMTATGVRVPYQVLNKPLRVRRRLPPRKVLRSTQNVLPLRVETDRQADLKPWRWDRTHESETGTVP